MQRTLAVIFGGEGAERRISEISAANVIEKINGKINFITVGITDGGDWLLFGGDRSEIESGEWIKNKSNVSVFPARINGKSGFYTEKASLIEIDAAFPVLHGDFGEDGTVQGALRAAHIPYYGSKILPSAISSDKAITKIMAEYVGIPTLPWFIPKSADKKDVRLEAEKRLGYPFFIKPRALGSSIGASAVYSRRDFDEAFEKAVLPSDGKIMIESLASVKLELELALFDDGKRRFISKPGVIYSSGKFYGFSEKYESLDSIKTSAEAKLDLSVTRKLRSMAKKLADFLELGNVSRIDFFQTTSGEIFFNEINSIPGMTKTSLYPEMAELYGSFGTSVFEALANGEPLA